MPAAVSSRSGAAPASGRGLRKERVSNPASSGSTASAPAPKPSSSSSAASKGAPISGRRATTNVSHTSTTSTSSKTTTSGSSSAARGHVPALPSSGKKSTTSSTTIQPPLAIPRKHSGISGHHGSGAGGVTTKTTTGGGGAKKAGKSSHPSSSSHTPTDDAGLEGGRRKQGVEFLVDTDLDRHHEVASLNTTKAGLDSTVGSLDATDRSVFSDEPPPRSDTPEFLKATTGTDDGGGSAAGSASASTTTAPVSALKGAVDTSTTDEKVQDMIAAVSKHWGLVRRSSSIGSPSDSELKKLEEQRKAMEDCKLKAARDIALWGTNLTFHDPEGIEEEFADFLDRLILETDGKGGNLVLVEACLKHFVTAIDFPKIIIDRQWIINSAADGSLGFMKLFFAVPNIADAMVMDVPEIVATCSYNQSCRIPLMRLLLDHDKVLRLDEQKEDLEDYFNEFFAEVASTKKAIPREDRNGRMELLSKMLTHPHITIKVEEESSDGMSIFTRAAAEGDDDVLQLLLQKKVVKDINAGGSDGCTALIHATFGNHVFCVRQLLAQKAIKTGHAGPEGTALDIAKMLQRHPEIIAALEAKR